MSQDTNCVQVRRDNDNDMIVIGNSRSPEGPFLSYTQAEWSAFLDGAKKGEFDDFAPRYADAQKITSSNLQHWAHERSAGGTGRHCRSLPASASEDSRTLVAASTTDIQRAAMARGLDE
jgi:hypothetical protein